MVDRPYHSRWRTCSRRIAGMLGFALAAAGVLAVTQTASPILAVFSLSLAAFGADMTISPSWVYCADIASKNTGSVSGAMNMIGNLYLLGEVTQVHAHLRRLNPVIRDEDCGPGFFRFASGATAVWNASRYNEVGSPSQRYTFGQMRIDTASGHITLDREANLCVKPLGRPGYDVPYPHQDINFAGDCIFALQRHFVDCLLSGAKFESHCEDYLLLAQRIPRHHGVSTWRDQMGHPFFCVSPCPPCAQRFALFGRGCAVLWEHFPSVVLQR